MQMYVSRFRFVKVKILKIEIAIDSFSNLSKIFFKIALRWSNQKKNVSENVVWRQTF